MAVSIFRLPDLGEGLTEADVVEWYVAEGGSVALDQPVVALESAKAVVDIPSPVAGRVRRHCAQPGETVATGAPLVEFEIDAGVARASTGAMPDAAAADSAAATGAPLVEFEVDAGVARASTGAMPDAPPADAAAAPGPSQADVPAAPDASVAASGARPAPARPEEPPSSAPPDRIVAMPAARAKARALGIDLATVTGTGPQGRIRVGDVERAARQSGRSADVERAALQTGRGAEVESAAQQSGHDAGEETLRGVRKTMAQRMARSHARVVPVTVTEDADIGDWRDGEDVTVRLVRAVVAGCAASPALNAWFEEDPARRTLHREVHLGIAADTGDGLFVPVLRDAGAREPRALRAEVDRLRAGVVSRSLGPQELDGATITLSNFGMLAGRYGTPIVVPPQVAILGAGRAREEPVARDGALAIRRRMPLSLTFDHRACTGAESSRFLAAVVADLERST